jgi:hypothetical protein
MRRMLLLFMLVIVTVPLAGCVVYPARPHAPYAGDVWVPGHYGPNFYWIRGHYA